MRGAGGLTFVGIICDALAVLPEVVLGEHGMRFPKRHTGVSLRELLETGDRDALIENIGAVLALMLDSGRIEREDLSVHEVHEYLVKGPGGDHTGESCQIDRENEFLLGP